MKLEDDKIWWIECCCTFDEQNPDGKPLDMLNMFDIFSMESQPKPII